MCRCDVFPDEHADGLVVGDLVCELAMPSPTISAHIVKPWWVGGFVHVRDSLPTRERRA
jgi:hypothetical protein